MTHGGVYKKNRFTQDAQDTTPSFGEAIQSSEVEAEIRTQTIILQQTADSQKFILPSLKYPITIVEMKLEASAAGATTTTTAGLTANVILCDAGFATTTNIGTLAFTATTSSLKTEASLTGLSVAVAAGKHLQIETGATTKTDLPATLSIQYTVD